MREVGPHVHHEGSGAGALTMAPAYIVGGGVGDRWQVDTTGPAEAYWKATGVGGRYEPDPAATSHDASVFLQPGSGRVIIR